jgi:hypothetical protein
MKPGVVVLDNKKKKKPIFNPDLKNTMSSVVGGAGEASAGTGAVMASVDNNMFLNFLNNLKTPENVSLIESIKSGFKIIIESGPYEYDDITDLEHPDDIERAFYNEDEPEKNDNMAEYKKYVDELINIIRRYGYWSEQVKEFNETIPYELDTLKIHNAARWQTEH